MSRTRVAQVRQRAPSNRPAISTDCLASPARATEPRGASHVGAPCASAAGFVHIAASWRSVALPALLFRVPFSLVRQWRSLAVRAADHDASSLWSFHSCTRPRGRQVDALGGR